jgi:ElaB/YqjD/DUF883 family membrane-anchored ribosome-binding protein
MSNQYSGRPSSGRQASEAQRRGEQNKPLGTDTISQVSDLARGATNSAKQAASDVASTITDHVKDILDTQLASGVEMVGQFGSSAHRAAEELDNSSPQLAGLVRGVADRIEGYADDMRDQSVDQLVRSASDFTRRQPAVVFGLAALAGFFAFRTLKSTPVPNRRVEAVGAKSSDRYQASGYHGI